jgi:hypothetical protein
MVDAAWTFTVIFMAIGAALVAFAWLWLKSEHSSSEHPSHHGKTPRTH